MIKNGDEAVKKGINAWCLPDGLSFEECFAVVKQAGFDGFEINMEEHAKDGLNLHLNATEDEYAQIMALSKAHQLPVASISTNLHWAYPLTDTDIEKVAKGKEIVRKMIDAAHYLGADTVLVVPGLVTAEVAYDTAYERAITAFKDLSAYAERKNVIIGVENVWNKFLLSPLEMKRFIETINSPCVKCYFDAGNVLQFGYPEQWVHILGAHIAKVHVKDFDTSIGNITGFKALFHGELDFAALVASLKKCGYDGYLTAELSPYRHNPLQLVKDTAEALEHIIRL